MSSSGSGEGSIVLKLEQGRLDLTHRKRHRANMLRRTRIDKWHVTKERDS